MSWKHTVILAGILAVAVVHFVVQLSFIQSEKLRSAESSDELTVEIAPPETQIIDVKADEYEVRKVKVVTIPERVAPQSRRRAEVVPVKGKIVRETRAERLRRAERILTGI